MTNASRQSLRRERILAATLTVLLGTVLLTSHAVSGAMAKCTTAGNSSDEARVALFGHSEAINFGGTWPGSTGFVPGASSSVGLYISNFKDGKVSEVTQTYEIEVVTAGNLPLRYELHKKDGNGKVDTTVIDSFNESSNSTSHTFKITDSTTFEAGVRTEARYQILAIWDSAQDSAQNSAAYAGRPDFAQVNINVKQID